MGAQLKALRSPLDVHNAETYQVEANQTLDSLFSSLSKTYNAPSEQVLCVLNGEEIKADKWQTTYICDGDSVMVCQRVHGLETFAINLLISLALSVVSYLLTSVPEVDQAGEIPDASPTYDLEAQGNKARLGKAIPVRYGRHRVFPDFAALPYREYQNDDQYLYQLFAIGQGEYNYYDLKIGDTPIANFDEVEYEFYAPGQKITLFRDAVNTSTEVTNTTLFAPNDPDYAGISGPFITNAVGSTVEEISVDFVIAGLYFSNKKGGLDRRSIRILVEYRDVDDNDNPVGGWQQFEDKTFTAASVDTIRATIRKAITTATGRVQVQAKRLNNTSDDYRERDEIAWTGLKAYLESDQTYDHSVWAVKAKATNNLSSQNERLFNLVPFRKLPVWDGSAWSALQETRNPVWAFCDALKAGYGGGYSDNNLKLAELKALADEYDTRNDYFDGSFDTKSTLWVALKKVCLVGRAEPIQYGETFSIVRDGPHAKNTYLFNGRNTVKGSMETQFLTVDQFADDSVEIEYRDETTWTIETVTCSVPGSAAVRPKKVKLFGCSTRLHAMREGTFMAAKQEYRNRATSFKTELDGRNIRYLDNLVVVQDLHNWGQGGEVIAVNGQALTLSEPVNFAATGTHQIYLRQDNGLSAGPFTVSGSSGDEVTLIEPMPAWVYAGDQKEKTYFAFVTPTNKPRMMLAQNVKAAGDMQVTIQAVIDDPRVHSFDALINDGTIITPPAAQPRPVIPFVITNLIVLQVGSVQQPELQTYWQPVDAAKRYVVEVSYDEGGNWQRVTTVETSSALFPVRPGLVDIRIAPQNDETGSWYQRQIDVGTEFATPPTPTGLQLDGLFNGTAVNVTWLDQPTAASWFVEVADLGGDVRYQQALEDIGFSYRYDQAQRDGVGREFDINLYAVNGNGVQSAATTLRVKNDQVAKITSVTATGFAEQIMIEYTASGEPDFSSIVVYASETQGFTPDANTLIAQDIKSPTFSFPAGYDKTYYIRIAGVDVWGSDELNFSDEVTASSGDIVATVIHDDFIETPMLKANAVNASKISVPNLSAISAVMGTLTSGVFKTSSLLGYRAEMSSEGDFPLWYGTGAKTAANGKFYVDKNGNLVAKGLSIYDNTGQLVISAGGAFSGSIPSSSVTGLGAFAALNQLNSANASTYIANAAIPRAAIGALNVQTADIVDANVTTLKIAGRAVTNPVSAYSSGTISWQEGEEILQTATIEAQGGHPVNIAVSVGIATNYAFRDSYGVLIRVYRGGSKIHETRRGVGYFHFEIDDTPSAGMHTYQVRAITTTTSGGIPNSYAVQRRLGLMGVKR